MLSAPAGGGPARHGANPLPENGGSGFDTLLDWLSLSLLICFVLLLLVIVTQIVRIIRHRHRKRSFQFVFLLLCLPWMLLRITLLALTFSLPDMPRGLWIALAWLPVDFQIASYTLLIVFFVQTIYRGRWEAQYRARAVTVWTVGNAVLVMAMVVWIALASTGVVTPNSREAIFSRYLITGALYGVLSGLYIYYGAKLQVALRDPAALLPFKANGRSVRTVAIVTVVLVALFAARAIYCWVIAAFALARSEYHGDENPIFRCASVFLSEIVPTTVILAFFWHVPSARPGARIGGGKGRNGLGSPFRFPSDMTVNYSPLDSPVAVIGGGGGEEEAALNSGAVDRYGAIASPLSANSSVGPHDRYDDDDDDDAEDGDAEIVAAFRFPARSAVVAPVSRGAPGQPANGATARRAAGAEGATSTSTFPFNLISTSGAAASKPSAAPAAAARVHAPAPAPAPLITSSLYLPSGNDVVDFRAGKAFVQGGSMSTSSTSTTTAGFGWRASVNSSLGGAV